MDPPLAGLDQPDCPIVGLYTSLAIDSSGYYHISYYDASNQDLKYARWNGVSWEIRRADSTGDVGQQTSLALDSNKNAHISYYDSTQGNLKYARWTGSAWDIRIVDSPGDVGMFSSIALTSGNAPAISYYDHTNARLKYARWTGSAWEINIVANIHYSMYNSVNCHSNQRMGNNRRNNMKRIILWIAIINLIVLNSCTTVRNIESPCNEKLLESFISTQLSAGSTVGKQNELIFDVIDAASRGKFIENFQWDISERDKSGCVVVLSATINGVITIGPAYFIKLPEYSAYPDNDYAEEIVSIVYTQEDNWADGFEIDVSP